MNEGMSAIVKTASCLVLVPVMVFGMYVILHGHLTPGGGFPGGAVMATGMAMLLVAFGAGGGGRLKRKDLLSSMESVGLLAFAAMAFIGIRATFFRNFLANGDAAFGMYVPFGPNPGYMLSAGVMPLMNAAVGLEVFAALSAVVILMFTGREGGGK